MPTIAADRELLQCNVPHGCRAKLDALVKDVKKKHPEAKRICQDRGLFLDWLIDNAWRIKEETDSISPRLNAIKDREDELNAREQELTEYEKKLNQKNRQLAEIDNELCQQLDMLPYAKDLWMEVSRSKLVSKEELLSTLKLMKEAGIDFGEVVKAIHDEDLPDFMSWARKIKDACLQGSETLANLQDEISAHKKALEQIQGYERELTKKIEARKKDMERANLTVAMLCATARDTGLYLDYIKKSCQAGNAGRIQELPIDAGMVVAGVVLEAVASAYGDKEVTIPPSPKHYVPVQVTIREIARSLAPPEAYMEQQKAQMKMEVKAEAIAAG